MFKKHLKAIDNLSAPQSAVEKALRAAREAQSGKIIEMKKSNKRKITFVGVSAACLALIIGIGSAVIPRSSKETTANSFTITANAAELKNKLGDESFIGAFEGDGGSAWMLDTSNLSGDIHESGNYYKDGFIDTFWEFNLSKLRIKGSNIESVSLKSESDGVYFGISPTSGINYDNIEFSENGEFYYENGRSFHVDKKQIKEWEQLTKEKSDCYTYSDTISTSQYTKAEFKKYGDGFSGENICNIFTFTNKNGADEINLDRDINLVTESIHSNPKIAEWLKQLRKVYDAITDAKIANDEETLGKGYNDEIETFAKIIKETVTDAQITLTVNFTDKTSQSKTLNLAYAPIEGDDDFPCIAFK